MKREALTKEAITIINLLPDDDLILANQMLKKLVLAWDPDFTKLTPAEREKLEHIQSNDEYVSASFEELVNGKAEL